MTPIETTALSTVVVILAQIVKRLFRSEGSLVIVIVLLIAVGLAMMEVVTQPPYTGRDFLDAFYQGVAMMAAAMGIHGAFKTLRSEESAVQSQSASGDGTEEEPEQAYERVPGQPDRPLAPDEPRTGHYPPDTGQIAARHGTNPTQSP